MEAKREARRQAEEAEIKISDEECYAMLSEEQQKQYKQKKTEKNRLRKKQILAGKFEFAEDDEGVAYSLLTEEQRQARQLKHEQLHQQA